jgi:putative ABC transport system permease protein
MWKATKASLLAHKLRLLLTALAVTAGVGFVCGTLVLTDTLASTFTTLFEEVSGNKSVIVTGVSATGDTDDAGVPLPDSTIERVKAMPGVSAARGDVFSFAQLVDQHGKAVNSAGGAPTFGTSHQDGPMSSTGIARGKAPKGPDELAIDKSTADRLRVPLGTKLRVVTITGIREYTLVGVLTFGSRDNLAGATQVSWDLPTAQQVLGRTGMVDEVDVLADKGISDEALRDRIAAALGAGYKVQTGKESAAAQADQIKQGLAFFSYFLGGFAVISLLVGSFIIVNTFSILVAQRTRELALLRALGASRRQVLGSVLGEAAATGLVGSAVGVIGGILLAVGIKALFGALGVDLPTGLPVVRPRTVFAGLGIGLVVTTAAAIVPAFRASQVPPVAAMSGATTVRTPSLLVGVVSRLGAIALGVLLLVKGSGLLIALGALLAFVGVVLLLSLFASPLAGIVGYPVARLGIVGRLGQTNATRNPRRTASTAAALMVGLALVGGAGTLQASANASIGKLVDNAVKADFVVQGSGFNGLSPAVSSSLAGKPGVGAIASIGGAQAKVGESRRSFSSVTADGADLIAVEVVKGSVEALRSPDGLLISADEAKARKLAVGDTLEAVFPKGAHTLKVGGIYATNQIAGDYLISSDVYRASVPDPLDFVVVVRAADGQVPTAAASIKQALVDFPAAKVQTRKQFIDERKQRTAVLLGVVLVLLVLSVLIAVLGVINTLALSVYERTREIGLLRAVGSRRGQVAAMVVVESVLVAVIGGVLGLVIGTGIGGGAVAALRSQGLTEFRVPIVVIVAGVIFSLGAGLVASFWPAFRATRLNILDSIAVD